MKTAFNNIDEQNKKQITPYQKKLDKHQKIIKNIMNTYYRNVIISNLYNTINYCYYNQNDYYNLIEQYKAEINKCGYILIIKGRQTLAQLCLKYFGDVNWEE